MGARGQESDTCVSFRCTLNAACPQSATVDGLTRTLYYGSRDDINPLEWHAAPPLAARPPLVPASSRRVVRLHRGCVAALGERQAGYPPALDYPDRSGGRVSETIAAVVGLLFGLAVGFVLGLTLGASLLRRAK